MPEYTFQCQDSDCAEIMIVECAMSDTAARDTRNLHCPKCLKEVRRVFEHQVPVVGEAEPQAEQVYETLPNGQVNVGRLGTDKGNDIKRRIEKRADEAYVKRQWDG